MIRLLHLLLVALLGVIAASASAGELRSVRFGEVDGKSRCVIELSEKATYRVANQSAANRAILIEVNGVTKTVTAATGTAKGLTSLSVERNADKKQAILRLKTSGAYKILDFTLENPARIVLDLVPLQASEPPPVKKTASSKAGSRIESTAPPTSGPKGPWLRRIIIDPGHGGYHKGGVGRINGKEVYEKQVTISVGEKLERLFLKDPRFEVRLTRREDKYMGLQERTVRASELAGDLFISIHANAVEGKEAQRRAKGFEIWTWNRNANKSAAAKAIERLENDDPGMTRDNNSLLTTMMVDALESQALVSRRVAQAVHGRAIQHPYLAKNDRGVDSARFKVLEVYDMPSILVELGFMTHPEEVKLLFSEKFQNEWAEIMYDGVIRYYEQSDPTFPRMTRAQIASARSK